MAKIVFILSAMLLLLTSCQDISDARAATSERISDKIYEWVNGEKSPVPEPNILESRYCYEVQADVLCYDTPQLGKEDQFVGSQ